MQHPASRRGPHPHRAPLARGHGSRSACRRDRATDGRPFSTWEDFVQYREPFGLGMRAEVAAAVLAETDDSRLLSDVMASVRGVAKHGTNQHTRAGLDNIKS